MANTHGDFIWYELMTSDVEAATAFYGAVIGWQARPFSGPEATYNLFSIGGADVGGLMAIPEEAACRGAWPGWLGYVGVDDVDAAVADIIEAGGSQHMPPTDIPGVGRLAMMADPQGATFYVMRGTVEGTSTSFAPDQMGHCHWNELATSDQTSALAFYRDRFGWQNGDVMPMGEQGDYQYLTHGGAPFGGVMTRCKDAPAPMWTFYFRVADIHAAASAVTANGGTIHHGPADVPGGYMIIVAADPQRALFGLVAPCNG